MPDIGTRSLASLRLAAAVRSGLDDRSEGPERRAAATAGVDAWLDSVWTAAWEDLGEGGDGPARTGVVLSAVGGHARRDSGPAGDLDLVLIHDGSLPTPLLATLADKLWYPIWDNGFRLDHAVRTVAACREVASHDVAVAVGMLELRPIAGDADLALRTRHVLREDWRKAAKRRVPEIVDGVRERAERHGDLAYLLEGDVKLARGGLRDAAMIDALVATWLADAPHDAWQAGRAWLLDVRDALHVVLGRPTERLILAEQDTVAAALGMTDADELLTRTSSAARAVGYALDQTIRGVQRAVAVRRGLRRLAAPRLRTIEPGLAVHEGEIVTVPGVADATLPLRAAASASRLGLPISAVSAARLAGRAAPAEEYGGGERAGHEAGDLTDPWPTGAREAFLEVLSAGDQLPALWDTLDHAGLIQHWLPEWDGVRNRPQRNMVHRYTVDRHMVETVVMATELSGQVRRPDLLLLAALLHDIGKRPNEQDHARAGVPVAREICRRIGLTAEDTDVVALLVAEHLTLVDLATRRDPDDPRTVQALVDAVGGDDDTLTLLRVLTEADARAAGPAAWTSWRRRLVDDLVARARAVLGGHPVPGPSPLGSDELDLVARVAADREPRLTVATVDDMLSVTVVATDRTGLFADIAGLLAAQGISVRSALIRTVDGIAVDTWWAGVPSTVPDAAVLRTALKRLGDGDRSVLDRLGRRDAAFRAPHGVLAATQVFLAPGAAEGACVVEVRALDRPGLLHSLGTALRDAGVDIRSAHVATHAGRAVDVLYLAEAGAGGGALSPARTAEVIQLLSQAAG